MSNQGGFRDAPDWSDAEKSQMSSLWKDGLSGSQIAREMPARSRAAVLGMARRLGLPARPQPARAPITRASKSALERGVRQRINRVVVEGVKLSADMRQLRGRAWEALNGVVPVSLLDLAPGMCKWPIGEGKPFLFCGADAEGSYCATHAEISHGTGTESERAALRVPK